MSKPKELKELAVKEYLSGSSLTLVADKYKVVPSTIFVWVKQFKERSENGKNDDINYSKKESFTQKDIDNLYQEIMRKDIEIERLKKGYTTRGGGTKKEYAILNKKNTK